MTRSRVTHDLVGGVVAGLLGLPEAMAYALVVFAPLGPGHGGAALTAGLTALCLINLGGALRPRALSLVSGPYSLAAVLLSGMLATLLRRHGHHELALTLLFAVVWIAGALQVGLGRLRLGDLGRYIPQPVLSGLLNGTALWILAAQLEPMLGLTVERSMTAPSTAWGLVRPLTLLVALLTLAVTWLGPRISKRVPAPLLGLSAGTLAHHALARALGPTHVGALTEAVPSALPTPGPWLSFFTALPDLGARDMLQLLSFAGALALVASLRSLITTVALDHRYGTRSDRSDELVSQGLGNALSGAFGGIASAGSVTLTVACREQGGEGRWARAATGLTALGVLVGLGPLVQVVPRAAVAAVVVVLCLRGFDRWSLAMLVRLLRGHVPTRASGADLLIMLLVTGVVVGVGTFEAVVTGVVISVALLLRRMGMTVVRRRWRGGELLSNVRRAAPELQALSEHGDAIRVLELEGSLFFGTADALVEAVDTAVEQGARFVVVDLQRITSMDSTGGFALLRAQRRCREAGLELLLSSTRSRGLDRALLYSMGVLDPSQQAASFGDLASALAHAEDRLLDQVLRVSRYGDNRLLGDFDALSGMSAAELRELADYLKLEQFEDGQVVCRQTEPGDRVHFIESGRARVGFRPEHQPEEVPLGTLCPGTMFGEMSILDRGPRSATVRAEGTLRCRVLHLSDFERLAADKPALALQLLRGIGRELSGRIRVANRMASELRD